MRIARLGLGTTWALLVAATLLSYASWFDGRSFGTGIAGSAVILIALGKAWLIGMRFMELSTAPRPLRWLYTAWIVVVGAILLAMFAFV